MRHLTILLAFALVAWAQTPKPGVIVGGNASGGGGGSYTAGTGLSLIGDQFSINTAVTARKLDMQSGAPNYCRSTTGNDTYVCALTPTLTAYTRGGCVVLDPDTGNTLTATIDVDTLGAKSILNRAGAALSTGDITANKPITICYDGTQYIIQGDGGGGGGSGDVVGPASAVDSAVALWDTTTGKLLKGTASAGTSGQALLSNGTGVSPSFQTLTRVTEVEYQASPVSLGGTNGAGPNISALGTFGGITYITPTLSPNTNPTRGYMQLPVAVSGTNYTGFLMQVILPKKWQSGSPTKIRFYANTGGTTGNRTYEVATSCVGVGETIDGTLTFNANQTVVTNMATGSVLYESEISPLDMTGCAAGEYLFIKVGRPDSVAGVIQLRKIVLEYVESLI